jgi:hypothetical protein
MAAATRVLPALLLCFVVVACRRNSNPTGDGAPPLPGLRARLNDRPLVLRSANAFAWSPHAFTLQLSSEVSGCARASQKVDREFQFTPSSNDEIDVSLQVRQVLLRDGSMPWRLLETQFLPPKPGPNTKAMERLKRQMYSDGGLGGIDVVQGDATKPVVVRASGAEIDSEISDDAIHLDGEIHAGGCGPVPSRPRAAARPQRLEPRIAGQSLSIQGATLREVSTTKEAFPMLITVGGEPRISPPYRVLLLSTAGLDCSEAADDEDARIQIALDGSPPRIHWVYLRGSLFPTEIGGGLAGTELRVTLDGAGDGGAPVSLSIDGDADLDGFAASFHGSVEPVACPANAQ